MRGKHYPDHALFCFSGNIPAYAGKTAGEPKLVRVAGEHPRVCGENPEQGCRYFRHAGTSPRMRGKPELIVDEIVSIGNIPAYAGKTWLWRF